MKRLPPILILIFVLQLSGCADMFSRRSFVDEMDHDTDGFFVPGQDFRLMSGDTGDAYRNSEQIYQRTPKIGLESREVQENMLLERELRKKERRLSRQEYHVYLQIQDQFDGTSEKVYYLSLPPLERRQYLQAKFGDSSMGRTAASSLPLLDLKEGLDSYAPSAFFSEGAGEDLFVGMSKMEVRRRLGGPSRVDVAGDPRRENERWSFYRNGHMQHVYFEAGKVQGWAQE